MSNGAFSQDEIDALLAGVSLSELGYKTETADPGQSDDQKKSAVSGGTQVLSKDEIDTLLAAINADDKKKAEASGVDERPMKFSREHIKGLSIIHQKFSYMAVKDLSDMLKTNFNIHVASVDQLYMDEFNRCIPVPSVLAVVSMRPLKGNIIIELDPSLTSAIINKIGGGTGGKHKQWYELTLKEKNVIINLFNIILGKLRDAWSEVIQISPLIVKIEPDPDLITDYQSTEWLALVTLETKVWDVQSMINICIPYPVLEPIMDKIFIK